MRSGQIFRANYRILQDKGRTLFSKTVTVAPIPTYKRGQLKFDDRVGGWDELKHGGRINISVKRVPLCIRLGLCGGIIYLIHMSNHSKKITI